MFRIIYISTGSGRVTQAGLQELLEQSREKNARLGITGLLLYKEGSFMQIIEGQREHVEDLYDSIRVDSRHRDVITLVSGPLEERRFPDWSMAFRRLEANEKLPGVNLLLEQPWDQAAASRFAEDIRGYIRTFMAVNG